MAGWFVFLNAAVEVDAILMAIRMSKAMSTSLWANYRGNRVLRQMAAMPKPFGTPLGPLSMPIANDRQLSTMYVFMHLVLVKLFLYI